MWFFCHLSRLPSHVAGFPLARCVVNLPVLCRPELVRMYVAGCSTALGRRSAAGFPVAARLSACARSAGLLRPSPSCVARIAQWEEMKKLPLVLIHQLFKNSELAQVLRNYVFGRYSQVIS